MQKIVAFLLLCSIAYNSSSAQFLKSNKKRVDFFSFIENTNGLLPQSLFSIDISFLKEKCTNNGLNVFLPDSFYSESNQGREIITAFIYNNSSDTIITSECDGMILSSVLEIKQNDKWIIYQVAEGIECWDGCKQQYLFPGYYSVLAIFSGQKGINKLAFRIKMKTRQGEYLSNVATGFF